MNPPDRHLTGRGGGSLCQRTVPTTNARGASAILWKPNRSRNECPRARAFLRKRRPVETGPGERLPIETGPVGRACSRKRTTAPRPNTLARGTLRDGGGSLGATNAPTLSYRNRTVPAKGAQRRALSYLNRSGRQRREWTHRRHACRALMGVQKRTTETNPPVPVPLQLAPLYTESPRA